MREPRVFDALRSAFRAASGDEFRAVCEHERSEVSTTSCSTVDVAKPAASTAAAGRGVATTEATIRREDLELAVATAPVSPESIASITGAPRRPRRLPHPSWAELLRRAWAFDVLVCRACDGRLRLVAATQERAVVECILGHLGLPMEVPQPLPARPPPEQQADLPFPDD